MFNQNTDVDILVNGKSIKKISHKGKLFIQSNHQTEYAIKIKNNSWARRLMVVSVDGINVIDGKAAGSTQMGYVVNGLSSVDIKGFRTDNDTVHPFKFSSKKRSYAAKSEETGGDTSNCGVIGVEVYDEKYSPPPKIVYRSFSSPPNEYRPHFGGNMMGSAGPSRSFNSTLTASTTDWMESDSLPVMDCAVGGDSDHAFCASYSERSAKGIKPNFDMGTEFSEESVRDSVREVSFDIGSLVHTISIYYASRGALIDMKVPVVQEKQIAAFPQAFPDRFCRPPRR